MRNGKKDISVTLSLVVYKGYDDAWNAIQSIESFTDPALKKHIYVIDNSCYPKDEPSRIQFENKLTAYPDVSFIDVGANVGFGKGHNYILNQLDSDYHTIVNPDILVKNDALTALIRYLEQHPEAGMVIPRIVDIKGNVQAVYRREVTVLDFFNRMFLHNAMKRRSDYHTMQSKNYEREFRVPFGQGSFLMIRTDLYRKLGGFDDRYFMYMEDADLCRQVNQVSKLMYVPDAVVMHKWEKASHKSFKLFRIHLSSVIAYFKKWGIAWR